MKAQILDKETGKVLYEYDVKLGGKTKTQQAMSMLDAEERILKECIEFHWVPE